MHNIQIRNEIIKQSAILFDAVPDLLGREKMLGVLREISGNFDTVTIGRSILAKPIEVLKIGKGKKKICIFAAHHALENITVNISFLLSLCLLVPDFSPSLRLLNIPLLLDKYTYYIAPCVNPDGVELHLRGISDSPLRERQMRMSGGDFSSWQANARGVDLNHNYAYRFDEYKLLERDKGIKAGATLYAGESAESEPECRSVANFVRFTEPCAVISLHTQGEELYYMPKNARTERIAKRLAGSMGYKLKEGSGTDAYSGLCDYTGSLGIPSFTVELGRGKNPLPREDTRRLLETVAKGIISLPTYM